MNPSGPRLAAARFVPAGLRARPRLARTLATLALAVLALVALRLWPHAPLRARLGESTPVYARHGELLRLSLAPDQQYRLWTPLDDISPLLVQSALLYEDRGFWRHPGIDPLALGRSAWHTARGGRREGASTVTMQLARRLYAIDSRTPSGKLEQMGAALWLEATHSKREILEAWLNTVPYGGNIEGVGAASRIGFGHPASKLTMPESLTLAVIPQHPARRLAAAGPGNAGSPDLLAARARLWALWQRHRPEDAARHAAAAMLPPPAMSRASLPFLAPHATDLLLAASADPQVRSADGAIHTTLDLAQQRAIERVVAGYLKARGDVGLRNASAMLLDASTMEVRAVVGSANYHDAAIQGQVNGTQAKRSPGSTLKPFIYAMALDQGLLHPRTLLRDAPTAFGPFSPENFDGQFMGPVAAQDALVRSRNVPAVAVAARLGHPNLYEWLRLNGVSRLESEQHYGLALVLGGGEVTMEELARMYAVLANDGLARPVSYTRDQSAAESARESTPEGRPPRLLSPEAAFITLDMLRHSPRPDTGAPAVPAVAWKTGTSWGFRDAWTAGVFGRHVLVVWVGDFDGASNPAFIGIDAAAPLYLRIVDALRAQGLDPGEVAHVQPPDLRRVEVCTATGALPDALCPARTSTWFIAGKSPIASRQLHRTVWIDAKGRTLCGPEAASAPGARAVVVEEWGSEMRRLFRQSGLPRRDPGADGDCRAGTSADATLAAATDGQVGAAATLATETDSPAPRIASPLRGVSYVVDARHPEPVPLKADAAAGVHTLYWFAGASLLGRVKPGETLAWSPPQPGRYALRVVDDRGHAETRELVVEARPLR